MTQKLARTPIAFISWRKNIPRSMNLSRVLGATDYYVEYLRDVPKFLLPFRYLLQTTRTLLLLIRKRPKVIITMNPPLVLPLVCYCYAKVSGARLVIDSHTGVFIGAWARLLPLHRFLSKRSFLTIVTNEPLKRIVTSWGARGLVLEDPLPELPIRVPSTSGSRAAIAVINSFSDDEPLDEILAAAHRLPEYDLFITGRLPAGARELITRKPENVEFTGFIPDDEYATLLNAADAIMVLVKTDYTMLCGAYEAVAVEKPLITSNWPVLRDYFNKGTLYVDNSPEDIARAVKEAVAKKAELVLQMRELKQELPDRWNVHLDNLQQELGK